MTYAFLTDGLDSEKKEELDNVLEGKPVGDTKAKIRRERAVAEEAMRRMR